MGRVLQHHASVTSARKAVLRAYRACGHVRHACAIAKVSKTWLYWQLAHRPSFQRRWRTAKEAYKAGEQERREQAALWQAVAASKQELADHRVAVRQYIADLKADRAFEQRWQKAQERKRRRAEQQAQRDAWRTANPNWRQLERDAREGWQRVQQISARLIAEEQDPDSALSAYVRQHETSARRIQADMTRRRGFDALEEYDPDC